MKAFKTIIISAGLFLALQSHSFATNEQEDMELILQAKLGLFEFPTELHMHIFSFLD
jgi:hypothetical protein